MLRLLVRRLMMKGMLGLGCRQHWRRGCRSLRRRVSMGSLPMLKMLLL